MATPVDWEGGEEGGRCGGKGEERECHKSTDRRRETSAECKERCRDSREGEREMWTILQTNLHLVPLKRLPTTVQSICSKWLKVHTDITACH